MVHIIRLGEKTTVDGQLFQSRCWPSGGDEERNTGPAKSGVMSQGDAIHRTRHAHVGEDDPDAVMVPFESFDRFLGVAGFEDGEARLGKHVSST